MPREDSTELPEFPRVRTNVGLPESTEGVRVHTLRRQLKGTELGLCHFISLRGKKKINKMANSFFWRKTTCLFCSSAIQALSSPDGALPGAKAVRRGHCEYQISLHEHQTSVPWLKASPITGFVLPKTNTAELRFETGFSSFQAPFR